MGVNLKDIINAEAISFSDLKGKVIAVDALNSLYQFLASIRQQDGTPLMDSKKNVTSHLSGVLYRTIRLLELGIKPVYVFDGKPPHLKGKEIAQRSEAKEEAHYEWIKAKEEGRIEDAKKYAMRTSRLTSGMLRESKDLLHYMGMPCIQAPSEGEAQCVKLCMNGDAWAVGSQDYDSLLLGAPRLVRGMTMSGTIELSMITLERALKELGVTREQLVELAIFVGTDFNDGIKGIGPKKALKAVKEGKTAELRSQVEGFDEIKELFMDPEVTDEYSLSWGRPDRNAAIDLLCKEHEFSEDRVNNAYNNLEKYMKEFSQKDLSAWF